MALMTMSSMLVPVGGLVTAPILARALSTGGRGEFAAGLAPSSLILAAATLGLPDALIYTVAKWPERTRKAVLGTSIVTLVLGLVCVAITTSALPFLSAGDSRLASYIILASLLTVPALVIGTLRGAATGAQMWREIVLERVFLTVLRIGLLGTLFLLGDLTVLNAVIVSTIVPWVAGLVYLRVLRRPDPGVVQDRAVVPNTTKVTRQLVGYGSKVWLGSVAGMLLARVSSLLMVPLTGVDQLGLYAVAVTISDVPVIAAFTIQGTLFSLTSKSAKASEVTATSRITTAAALAGCSLMGVLVPFFIGPLFGFEFVDATLPTLILLFSAVISVPGLMCASGLSAWGRPGLRSLGLLVALVTNVLVFVLLVPRVGAIGAAWASVASNAAMTTIMLIAASRLMNVNPRDALILRRSDITRLRGAFTRVVAGRLVGRRA